MQTHLSTEERVRGIAPPASLAPAPPPAAAPASPLSLGSPLLMLLSLLDTTARALRAVGGQHSVSTKAVAVKTSRVGGLMTDLFTSSFFGCLTGRALGVNCTEETRRHSLYSRVFDSWAGHQHPWQLSIGQ
jgi:hypothetical protein